MVDNLTVFIRKSAFDVHCTYPALQFRDHYLVCSRVNSVRVRAPLILVSVGHEPAFAERSEIILR